MLNVSKGLIDLILIIKTQSSVADLKEKKKGGERGRDGWRKRRRRGVITSWQ